MGKRVQAKLGHYKPNTKFHRCIPFVCLVYRITDQPEFNKKNHKVGQGENIFPLSLSDTSLNLAKQKKYWCQKQTLLLLFNTHPHLELKIWNIPIWAINSNRSIKHC